MTANSGTDPWSRAAPGVAFPAIGVRHALVLLAVFTLPFTDALTLNIRFPLKVYELALLAAAGTYLLDFRLRLPRSVLRDWNFLSGFVLLATVLFLVRLLFPAEGLSTSGFESRFGPLGDGVAKLLYLGLSAFGFAMFAAEAYRHERSLISWWLGGAIAASLYSWYLFASSLLGHDPYLLPGMAEPQRFALGPLSVIRSGTFEEGNFFGLYLLVSVGIAAYARRWITALLLTLTVIISFSTINVLGLALFWGWLLWTRRNTLTWGRRLLYGVGIALFLLIIGGGLLVSGYLQTVLVEKLGSGDPGSRLDRMDLILAGLRMFLAHPLFGVGISQYGYYYDSYRYLDLPTFFHPAKVIPNNVYIELLAELGLLGFGYFTAWLLRLYRRIKRAGVTELRITLLATALVLNAFPTYSIMFLWAFFGLVAGVAARSQDAVRLGSAPSPIPA